MQGFFSKIRVGCLLVSMVFVGSLVGQYSSYAQSCIVPSYSLRKNFVQAQINSLSSGIFNLIDDNDFRIGASTGIDNVFTALNSGSPTTINIATIGNINLIRKDLRASSFWPQLHSFTNNPSLNYTLTGNASYAINPQHRYPSTLAATYQHIYSVSESYIAALYVPSQSDNVNTAQGFVSGFVMNLNGDGRWYFIEPVRSLLKLHDPALTETTLSANGLSAVCRTHVIYEVRDLQFFLKLGPDQHGIFDISFNIPSQVQIGSIIPMNARVRNKDTKAITARITLELRTNSDFSFTPLSSSITTTINPGASVFIALPKPVLLTSKSGYSVQAKLESIKPSKIDQELISEVSTQSVEVRDSIRLEEVLDYNNDNHFSDEEILRMMEFWSQSVPVPGTEVGMSGEKISDKIMIDNLMTWANNQGINPFRDSQNSPSPLNVFLSLVGDRKFTELTNFDGEKMWWQRQEEIANLIDSLFSYSGPHNNYYPGINVKLKSLETWTTDWQHYPGSVYNATLGPSVFPWVPSANAWTVLCSFIDPAPGPGDSHTFVKHADPGVGIVHIMTGSVLDPVANSLSDQGDGFCPAVACGGGTNRLVGLAEGIGGYKHDSNLRCNNILTSGFYKSAKHSISQHMPTPSSSSTFNYDTLLYQRFILVAHELGHNLNARHTSAENTPSPSSCNPLPDSLIWPPPPTTTPSCLFSGKSIMFHTLDHQTVFNYLSFPDSINNSQSIQDCLVGISPC